MKLKISGLIMLVLLSGSAHAKPDRVAAYFNKYDADGDGKLSKAESHEMTRIQLEKKGKTDYKEEAEKRFKNKDADRDGFISLAEYRLKASSQQSPVDARRAYFDRYDTDGSGKLSTKEFTQMVVDEFKKKGKSEAQSTASRRMTYKDRDYDEQLTFEEWKIPYRQ